ncbi:hypothetical protein BCR39DRAFT_562381 [Naematelia encephala]|uniref:N-acetyltransferase domain-containing protein n=1 Tax=Naematelia encephala TaxID=71784 RepID=A0A1Y2AI16_9TREE|nr:hypothetical protein BCR39DRAFT_562381 [Naematelia encephala]
MSPPVAQFFLNHPRYRSTPKPHLILPEPFSAFCLTLYSSDDKDDHDRIMTLPGISKYYGLTGRDDPKFEKTSGLVDGFMAADHLFPFIVIRETRLVESWTDNPTPRPPMIGSLAFARNPYHDVPAEIRDEVREREKGLSDQEGNWMATAIVLDPVWKGKGIMAAAYSFALNEWYLPHLSPPPGHMSAGWEPGNIPSQRLHEKVGFKVVCKRAVPKEGAGKPMIIAVWQGAGEIGKTGTIYEDNEDYVEDVDGAMGDT